MKTKLNQSIVWGPSKDEFQEIVNNSKSLGEILNKLGLQSKNGNNRGTLKRRIDIEGINLSLLEQNRIEERKKLIARLQTTNETSPENIFRENSSFNKATLRRKVLKKGLLPYKCCLCGNEGTHNGIELILQLDHINGINNDNRLENLRFLCPNCHTQTETWGSKKPKKICPCGKAICRKANICRQCSARVERPKKINWPTKEFLEKRIWEMPTETLAKELGVSGNAVAKHIKKLGLTKPPRGYWSKMKKSG